MSTAPALSVLMPVRNGETHLRPAIDSILDQTFGDFEFMIVDDGSTDRTVDLVRGYDDPRIRLERLGNPRGLSAALNIGLGLARAPLVARQDADDVSRPDRLARLSAVMHQHPELVLLGSQAGLLDDAGRTTGVVRRPVDDLSIRWYALFDNPFIHTSVVFRREIALACGGYDPAFDPFSQDYVLWWRIMQRGRVGNLSESLVDYRVNASSVFGTHGDGTGGEYWRRFDAMVKRAVSSHLLEAYGARGLSPDDANLLTGFVLGIEVASLPMFLDRFARVLDWFDADHPTAPGSDDFAATLARQYDAIAYRLRPATRSGAFSVYRHALGRQRRLASRMSWPRFLVMMTLGPGGRATAARWWASVRWN